MNRFTESEQKLPIESKKPTPMRQYRDDSAQSKPNRAQLLATNFMDSWAPAATLGVGLAILLAIVANYALLNRDTHTHQAQAAPTFKPKDRTEEDVVFQSSEQFLDHYRSATYGSQKPDDSDHISYHIEGHYFIEGASYFVFSGSVNAQGDAFVDLNSEFLSLVLEYKGGTLATEIDSAYQSSTRPLDGIILAITDPLINEDHTITIMDNEGDQEIALTNQSQIFVKSQSIQDGSWTKILFDRANMAPKARWDLLQSGREFELRYTNHQVVDGRQIPSEIRIQDHLGQKTQVSIRSIRRTPQLELVRF